MTIKKLRHAMITFLALLLAAALLLPASPTAAKPQAQEGSGGIPTDRIIIKYKEGSAAQAEPSASALMSSLSAAAGASLEYVRPMSGDAHVLKLNERLPEAQVEAISANLMTLPGVEYAEPDRIKRPALIPNDTYYDYFSSYADDQWNLMFDTNPDANGVAYGINAEPAWDITTGSGDVVVAVVDSGITAHEDLNPARLVPGYDFIGGDYVGGVWRYFTANDGDGRDADPTDSGDWITDLENAGTDPVTGNFFQGCGVSDSSWHGTHVAGILGAWSNNNTGVAGVDWNAKILPVRVLGKCGGYTSDIADGIRWAAGLSVSGAPANNYPAKVINLSLGGPGACSVTEQNAINDAVNVKGAVVVAAAGNENLDASSYSPGNCNNVITVASTDRLGYRSSFSNYGSAVEISAPGGGNGQGGVLSTINGGATTPEATYDYAYESGTSMAAPHVSGVVSLMFAVNPWMTPAHVMEILQKAVTPFPSLSTCNTSICGAGIVNAYEAVRLARMPDVLITNVTLSKVDPGLGEQFAVNITVKNRGGSTTDSIINLQLYVDRNPMDPSNPLFIDEADGGIVLAYAGGPEDPGEFVLDRGSGTLPANATETYSVIINNTVEPYNTWTATSPVAWGSGTHKLYAYVDANGINQESFEKNNHYPANPVTINPFIEGAPLYPKNNIGIDYNPNFKWNQVLGATSYRLYVTTSSGTALINAWHNASLVCYADNPTCAVSGGPGLFLKNGDYSWRVQPYNATTKTYGAWSATQAFKVEVPPGAALAPTGSIEGDYAPVYTWAKVDTATHYQLYVKGPGNVALINKVYPSAGTCNSETGLCTVKSPILKAGAHTWQVRPYSPAGYGAWSIQNFDTSLTKPVAPLLQEPAGDIGTNYAPKFIWQRDNLATQYRLYVKGPGGVVLLDKWYTKDGYCDTGTNLCTVQGPTLRAGAHTWQVMAYSPAGYSPWSVVGAFATNAAKPATPVILQEPKGSIGANYSPLFIWDRDPAATQYRLYLKDPAGTVVLDKWYLSSNVCSVDTGKCTVSGVTLRRVGLYRWQVQSYNPAGYGPWTYESFSDAKLAVTLQEPLGAIGANYTPSYVWTKVPFATHYQLYVKGPGGVVYVNKTYPAATVCNNDTGLCTVKSPTLKAGAYTWQVRTYSSVGYGDWVIQNFDTSLTKPGAPLLQEPAGDIGTNYAPKFIWQHNGSATQYRLYVKGPGGVVLLDKWYTKDGYCDTGTNLCTVQGPTLRAGAHTWQVMAYSPAGYSPWSVVGAFATNAAKPATPVILQEPKGDVGVNYSPPFIWDRDPAATQYRLYLKDPAGTVVLDKWYLSSNVCSVDTGKCTVSGVTLRRVGLYRWQVQSYNPAGYGPWAYESFSVLVPAAPTLIYPIPDPGFTVEPIGTNYNPRYEWQQVDQATQYLLYVKGPGGAVILNKWYPASQVCDGTICYVVSPTLRGGVYQWQVRAYNPSGYGNWSPAAQFQTDVQTIPRGVQYMLMNVTPNQAPNNKPVFTWQKSPMATMYRLYVKGPSGLIHDKWYTSVSVCSGDICSVVSPTVLAAEKYNWWVQPYNPAGYGPWRGASFNVRYAPQPAQNLSPSGSVSSFSYYSWDKSLLADKYHLYVVGPNYVLDEWYNAADICGGVQCQAPNPATLDPGEYNWWVMSYSTSAGYGPWSSSNFEIP